MTSPYLSKPTRSIKRALDDRGMTASDVGMENSFISSDKTNYRYLVIAFACLVIALGVVGMTSVIDETLNPDVMTAEEIDSLADEMSDLMPAAGGSD